MSAKRLGAFTGEFEEHALGLGDVLESVRLVETRGPIIDGVYDEGPGPQFHADAERPNDGVMKQATAQTVALEPSVDPSMPNRIMGTRSGTFLWSHPPAMLERSMAWALSE